MPRLALPLPHGRVALPRPRLNHFRVIKPRRLLCAIMEEAQRVSLQMLVNEACATTIKKHAPFAPTSAQVLQLFAFSLLGGMTNGRRPQRRWVGKCDPPTGSSQAAAGRD